MAPVLFVSGHRTDATAPAPARPRFPEDRVPHVREAVARLCADWGVGPGWTVITGASRGADLLVAQEARRLGAGVDLYLAKPADMFVRESIMDQPKTQIDWEACFNSVVADAQVHELGIDSDDRGGAKSYQRANTWMLDELERRARHGEAIHALLVWDGQDTHKVGGTWQVVQHLCSILDKQAQVNSKSTETWLAKHLTVIDPTPRQYETRQAADRSKRILALDGGGIRGIVSLEILAEIESQLRNASGRAGYVLADFFDLIAGTSTGAIIATALSQGRSVEEVRIGYQEMSRAAFQVSARAMRKLARFSPKALQVQLEDFFLQEEGRVLTLGDPSMRTLLLLVMHNITTDSPWLVTNNTRARYNRPDRTLPGKRDRNLDLPLIKLLRSSTAAPAYFPYEEITVGSRKFLFQDGGVTAFNNPALIAAAMAITPAYNLDWLPGPNRLLVVSVGTGSTTSTPRATRWSTLQALLNLRSLVPGVFMSGAAFSQDLLCRVVGRCTFGPPLDREVGDLVHQSPGRVPTQFGQPMCLAPETEGEGGPENDGSEGPTYVSEREHLFTYVRYDPDLSDEALTRDHGFNANVARKLRSLSAVSHLDDLARIGQHAAQQVSISKHFDSFVPGQQGLVTDSN